MATGLEGGWKVFLALMDPMAARIEQGARRAGIYFPGPLTFPSLSVSFALLDVELFALNLGSQPRHFSGQLVRRVLQDGTLP
jgi:hypothetical protein